MFKYNNTHLFTGYLKQKLANFNLPKYRVYTRENQEFFEKYGYEKNIIGTIEDELVDRKGRLIDKSGFPIHLKYVQYIKDGIIQEYVIQKDESGNYKKTADSTVLVGKWMPLGPEDKPIIKHYFYNKFEPNFTRRLIIKDNIYDAYTHEYLGDYLRFKRDYQNIDLMPLYNCFSNRICTRLNISNTSEDLNFIFDTSDQNFKIYMLPVKMFKNYTIAIESDMPVEMCCAVFGKYQDTRTKFVTLPALTYTKFANMHFSTPILYTKLAEVSSELENNTGVELSQNEMDLKLFIKLPSSNSSSVTILEGDYRNYNDSILTLAERKSNFVVTNYNTKDKIVHYTHTGITGTEGVACPITWEKYQDFSDFKPITQLQLLRLNTGESYPFADRLVEYLLDNAITSEDEATDDFKRVKEVMRLNGFKFNDQVLWEDQIRCIAYDYSNYKSNEATGPQNQNKRLNTFDNHDNLGYIDKFNEKNYAHIEDKNSVSISGIDIYEEDN